MKKTIIASAIALVFTPPAFSAENINLDDIVITASRVPQPREAVIGDVTVIGREEIERAGAVSVTDILRMQPGVQIYTNGGTGTASHVFLRGTNADHVAVLVDGLRINSATTGTTSFENIPLAQIEKIEILRGSASSLYGADAIGGVIQIFTRKSSSKKPLVHAAIGLGTYDTKTAEAGVSGGIGALRYGVNVSSLDTESFSAKRIRTNKDADDDSYRNLSVSTFGELELAPGHSWGLQFFESKGHGEFDSNYENYNEQVLQSYAFTSKNQFTDFWHSTFKLGMGVDDLDSHARPNTSPASASYNPTGVSQIRTEQQQLTWQNDFKLPIGLLTLTYDRLEQDVDSRSNVKTKFQKERNDDSFLASYIAEVGNHAMQLSLREDHNTQFGNYTTGGAGYAYQINHQWRANVNYGNAFKVPTFNQLYFPNFGAPTLQPEKSDNIETSVQYNTPAFNANLTVFQNNIRNMLANAGSATATCTLAGFCPINVGKTEIQGATLDASWKVSDHLILRGNFTTQSPRVEDSNKPNEVNQLLIRRANRYGTISLLNSLGDFQWGTEVTGSSTRYNDLANTKKMSGYMLVNLTANYKLSPEWKIEARANNIFDKNYILAYTGNTATAVPYNTAGSNLFVGLRYDMKH
ncbi:MAG: TonB-dependent receptor [Betaproteobacteria bacterium]|nr:TonB-dependent receptor [Betaproteobacteria bacterium]